ncbi:MAG: site-specific integrase [Pyrinomonadaceae bacterium]
MTTLTSRAKKDFYRSTTLRAGVGRAVHHHKGGYSFTEPKTTKSRRSIPLSASSAAVLKSHRRQQAEERFRQGSGYQNLDLVFATEIGTPIMQGNLRRRHLRAILTRAELPNSVHLYTLRHSCASLLLGAGENVKVIAERLGHADVSLTLNVYAHLQPGAQDSATQRMEKTLFG